MDKILLIFYNIYEDTEFELGNAVIQDSIYIQKVYSTYCCRLYKDITKSNFIKVVKEYLQLALKDLVIYFTGHGMQVSSSDNTSEDDGKDEALVFKRSSTSSPVEIRYIKDDDLTNLVKSNKCKNILMIFDCCHSGTMLDTCPDNVSCLYSCNESECSYQEESGIFTKFLYEHKDIPIKDILEKFNDEQQHPYLVGNRKYLLY